MEHPFKTADRYIELRKVCAPESWQGTMSRINDMIVMPVIFLFYVLVGQFDPLFLVPNALTIYRAWKEWMEYSELRFVVQRMYLHTAKVKGPFITTNDPTYLPYVFADAVVRTT